MLATWKREAAEENMRPEGIETREVPAATVPVTVHYWEERGNRMELKVSRTLPVETGSPVVWVVGKLVAFCRQLAQWLATADPNTVFKMQGAEVYWWTPVEQPAVLHVVNRRRR
jgi:hypothetical protein